MSRYKPEKEIYRPGSGPLRKSNLTGVEDNESESNSVVGNIQSSSSSPSSISYQNHDKDSSDINKKQKKPEKKIYVPPLRALASSSTTTTRDNNYHQEQVNGNYDNERYPRSRRFSNRRRGGNDNSSDNYEEWRSTSYSTTNRQSNISPPLSQLQLRSVRDTRSVEPFTTSTQQSSSLGAATGSGTGTTTTTIPTINRNYNERSYTKPPSGRRHSTTGLENNDNNNIKKPHNKILLNIDKLPPRLQKKYLEDNKINQSNDDNWNGASLTFQGSNSNVNSNNYHQHNYHQQHQTGNYQQFHHHPHHHQQQQQHHHHHHHHQNFGGYNTLPNRGRGRGRFHYDYDGNYRSRTPDLSLGGSPCGSRPPTPPLATAAPSHNRNKNDSNRQYSRPQSPANYQGRGYDNRRNIRRRNNNNNNNNSNNFGRRDGSTDRRYQDYEKEDVDNVETIKDNDEDQDVKDQTIKVPISTNQTILDWSEEVELNDRLEAEALSDTLTPSSSVTSLVDVSVKSVPPNNSSRKTKKKSSRRNRRHSGSYVSDHSVDNDPARNNDGFKVPESRNNHHHNRRRRQSKDRRNNSRSRNPSRDCSFDRNYRRNSTTTTATATNSECENWREEIIRNRQNSDRELSDKSRRNSERDLPLSTTITTATTTTTSTTITTTAATTTTTATTNSTNIDKINLKKGGVLVLPTKQSSDLANFESPKYPEVSRNKASQQKCLYDYNNPTKPIIVKSQSNRINVPGFSDNTDSQSSSSSSTLSSPQQQQQQQQEPPPQLSDYIADQFGNIRPNWYDENTDNFKSCHYPDLIRNIYRADIELTNIINSGLLLINWENVERLRQFLKDSLKYLLCKDLKFCQTENVEQHLWKLLYHNIIEVTRKAIQCDAINKEKYKGFLLYLIDEGTKYFENLLECLEESYKFKIDNYINNTNFNNNNNNNLIHLNNNQKPSGYIGLALISAQKLYLFLGDLGRYREQINETNNYGKCRQWYIKAHEINPKNGKPYNQLAVLAVYSRRKLDAVYYYMRSLMSSNPIPSAKEYLISLFDENRKKYEQGEKKRREERLERAKQHMKQKESESESVNLSGSLRHETWIRPNGGKRVHRTTQAVQEEKDSEEEDLAALSSVEVNKRFVISYLHVHGKLITKIGMESFQEAAMQMLKEFRALLQHSPVPLPCNRFLQLLALNMFAIESTQLKDPQLQTGYRSELQERALVISLQMFNLILERCVSLLEEETQDRTYSSLPLDLHVLLPAVKIWCDWMLCHSSVWNPPPSTQDFKVGAPGDAWSRLALLMNLLEKLDQNISASLITEYEEGYELVKLPEDSVLSGFTPLMVNEPDLCYTLKDTDMELAQFTFRLKKLLFFGTVFLCGLEPPVLKLEIEDDFREYVSVVCTSNSRDSPTATVELARNSEVLMESFSEDEDENPCCDDKVQEASLEVRELLSRKVELERTHRRQELHKQRVKKILSQAVVSVHIEVRPKYLVPDTNCFIDHLDRIVTITTSHVYTLMVPIVVLSELEGLSRGGKSPIPLARSSLDPQHIRKVAQAASNALLFLKNRPQMVKCVTTKGAVLSSTTFTTEDDTMLDPTYKNDDKILATCLVLNKNHRELQQQTEEVGEPKKLVSEVVLLTDDRNLRVKALSRDVPVRELVDFMQWAGLG